MSSFMARTNASASLCSFSFNIVAPRLFRHRSSTRIPSTMISMIIPSRSPDCMEMHRIMIITVEQKDQSEVLIEFRHSSKLQSMITRQISARSRSTAGGSAQPVKAAKFKSEVLSLKSEVRSRKSIGARLSHFFTFSPFHPFTLFHLSAIFLGGGSTNSPSIDDP